MNFLIALTTNRINYLTKWSTNNQYINFTYLKDSLECL